MNEVNRSIEVPASPDAVWAVLADFGSISRWAPVVDHSCLLSDRTSGVGTVRRVQTGRVTLVERVEVWEPGSRRAYVIEGLPPVLKSVTNKWTLEPAPSGCRVTLTSGIDAGNRPPQKLIAKAAGRRLGQASEEMLAGLKEKLS